MKSEKYKMEDALEYIIDYRGKTPKKSESGILTLSAKSVRDGYIDYNQCYYISEEEYARFMVRGFPQVGDVLLTTEAPLGVVARLDRSDIALAQRLLTLRGAEGILDTGFLYYYLRSPVGQGKLKERQTGTTVTGIKQAEFRKIEIDLPDLDTQKRIASVLTGIDEKIQINQKINKNLADLVQTVYQEQFGDVESADNQGILSEICTYSKEKVAISALNVGNYFSTENMLSDKAGATVASSLPTAPQTTACHKGDTLISNIRPYFKKIVYCKDDCGCSIDVLCFTPSRPQYSAYLFSTLYADSFFAFMVAGAKGTKMPRGDKQQIMTYPIVLPSDEEIEEFNDVVLPALEQIHLNRAENKRLSVLRDALLPKLMSGKLDISVLDL